MKKFAIRSSAAVLFLFAALVVLGIRADNSNRHLHHEG